MGCASSNTAASGADGGFDAPSAPPAPAAAAAAPARSGSPSRGPPALPNGSKPLSAIPHSRRLSIEKDIRSHSPQKSGSAAAAAAAAAAGGGGSSSHSHTHSERDVRTLPELPSAILLAAAFNDVGYFMAVLPAVAAVHKAASARPSFVLAPVPVHVRGESGATVVPPVANGGGDNSPPSDDAPPPARASVTSLPPGIPLARNDSAGGGAGGISVARLAAYVGRSKTATGGSSNPKHTDVDVFTTACYAGSAEVVELFIKYEPSLATRTEPRSHNTPLHAAASGPIHIGDLYRNVRLHLLHNTALHVPGDAPPQGEGGTPPAVSPVPSNASGTGAANGNSPFAFPADVTAGGGGGSGGAASNGIALGSPTAPGPSGQSLRMSGLQYLQHVLEVQALAKRSGRDTNPHEGDDGRISSVPRRSSPNVLSNMTGVHDHSPVPPARASNFSTKRSFIVANMVPSPSMVDMSEIAAKALAGMGTKHLDHDSDRDSHRDSMNEGSTPKPGDTDSPTGLARAVSTMEMLKDPASRFPNRSVEGTIDVLLRAGASKTAKNLYGKRPLDIASSLAKQIHPEACVSAVSTGSLIVESTLWERLLHPLTADWDAVAEKLFDPFTMGTATTIGGRK